MNETTCQAALGYAFAAGATDGHGDFDFEQGSNSTNPFWQYVSSFLAKPTPEQIQCQAPKPILLDVGLTKPIEWVPFILPQQIFQIGQLYIIGVPGEFTTMSGRRLKSTIQQALQNAVSRLFRILQHRRDDLLLSRAHGQPIVILSLLVFPIVIHIILPPMKSIKNNDMKVDQHCMDHIHWLLINKYSMI